MARHSAAETTMGPMALEAPRAEPPPGLSPEEARIWSDITAAMPPSWFDGANGSVLAELCHHVVLSRQIAEELATMRKWKLAASSPEAGKRRQVFTRLLREAREETRMIAMLATKLRLTNSSHRRDERYDDRRRLALAQGPKPWEDRN